MDILNQVYVLSLFEVIVSPANRFLLLRKVQTEEEDGLIPTLRMFTIYLIVDCRNDLRVNASTSAMTQIDDILILF